MTRHTRVYQGKITTIRRFALTRQIARWPANRVTRRVRLSLSLLFSALFVFAATVQRLCGRWRRAADDPIVSPTGRGWESAGTFNPAVVHGKFVRLYRAQDADGTSRLGYAESRNGIDFVRRPDPVLSPEADYEKDGGVEDLRLAEFGGTYYLTYTAFNMRDAQLSLATSKDLAHWQRKGVILPAYKGNWNVGWTKSGALVPEKINGQYWMYFLGTAADKTDQTGLAFSADLIHCAEATARPVLSTRAGKFDSRVVEPGPAPILTAGALSWFTTVPTINSSIGLELRCSIALTREGYCRARISRFLPQKKNGRELARSRTSSSLKVTRGEAIVISSITEPPTDISGSLRLLLLTEESFPCDCLSGFPFS
jgi:hypothetical protein